MSYLSRKVKLWQAMKFALLIRYGATICLAPKRRWLVVMEPDFLES